MGLDYDAQVRNNRSYVGDYLFYVTLEYSDTVAEGKIIRQEPAAGELLEEGGTISLVVSKGPEMIEMPNVIGFTQEGAVKELESRGLVPSCFMVVNDGSYASGCVVSCSAEAGTSVETGQKAAMLTECLQQKWLLSQVLFISMKRKILRRLLKRHFHWVVILRICILQA